MAVKLASARVIIDQLYKLTPCLTTRYFYTSLQRNDSLGPPKRPMGAFLIFLSNKMSDLQEKHPDEKRPTLVKIASQWWRDTDVDEKHMLLLEARERMVEYQRQHCEFLANMTAQEKNQIKKTKLDRKLRLVKKKKKMECKQLGKPKTIRHPYIFYLQSIKQTRGEIPFKFYMDNVSTQWKILPEQEKEVFREKYVQDLDRYYKEMKEWEAKMKEIGRHDLVRGYRVRKTKVKAKKTSKRKVKRKTVSSKVKISTSKVKTSKQTKVEE